MRASIRTADLATVRLVDGLVVVWLLLWLAVGAWTGVTLWHLAELGDTVTEAGSALGSAGEALRSLGDLPVVGDRPGELGDQVVAIAGDVVARPGGPPEEVRSRAGATGSGGQLSPMPATRRDVAASRRDVGSPP